MNIQKYYKMGYESVGGNNPFSRKSPHWYAFNAGYRDRKAGYSYCKNACK